MKRAMIVAVLLATLATSAFAAFDTYIQFKDATGKTVSIQIATLGNTAVTPAEFSSGKFTVGHRKWAPFVMTRKMGSGSPSLYTILSVAPKSLEILIYDKGPGPRAAGQPPVYTLQLTGVSSSKGQNASSDIEQVSLTFGAIIWTYTQNGADPKANWWRDTW